VVGRETTGLRKAGVGSRTRLPTVRESIGVGDELNRIACSAPLQERFDEAVEVAVQDRLNVPGLVARPLVLDELIRGERVRADLIAECNVVLLPRKTLELTPLLLPLAFGEPRPEDLHGLGPVLQL